MGSGSPWQGKTFARETNQTSAFQRYDRNEETETRHDRHYGTLWGNTPIVSEIEPPPTCTIIWARNAPSLK